MTRCNNKGKPINALQRLQLVYRIPIEVPFLPQTPHSCLLFQLIPKDDEDKRYLKAMWGQGIANRKCDDRGMTEVLSIVIEVNKNNKAMMDVEAVEGAVESAKDTEVEDKIDYRSRACILLLLMGWKDGVKLA